MHQFEIRDVEVSNADQLSAVPAHCEITHGTIAVHMLVHHREVESYFNEVQYTEVTIIY